ncbi:hypothetical protein CLOM_g11977 [Closterium sp. NIES-68]|nr:hypothetical protein CLOM_g11977 [Closterium sp. NIES-68]
MGAGEGGEAWQPRPCPLHRTLPLPLLLGSPRQRRTFEVSARVEATDAMTPSSLFPSSRHTSGMRTRGRGEWMGGKVKYGDGTLLTALLQARYLGRSQGVI